MRWLQSLKWSRNFCCYLTLVRWTPSGLSASASPLWSRVALPSHASRGGFSGERGGQVHWEGEYATEMCRPMNDIFLGACLLAFPITLSLLVKPFLFLNGKNKKAWVPFPPPPFILLGFFFKKETFSEFLSNWTSQCRKFSLRRDNSYVNRFP